MGFSRNLSAALLGLSVTVGVLLALQAVTFPQDTQVRVDYILEGEGRLFYLAVLPAVVMMLLIRRGLRAGRVVAIAMAPPYLLGLWMVVDLQGYGWSGHEADWMGVVRPVLALLSFALYIAGLCVLPKGEPDGVALWSGPVLTGLGWLAMEHGLVIGHGRDRSDPLWTEDWLAAANMADVAAVVLAFSIPIAVITCCLALVRGRRVATFVLALPYLLVLVYTSLNTPFEIGSVGATLVRPAEPFWYRPAYWIACAVMFTGSLTLKPPRRSVVRIEEKR